MESNLVQWWSRKISQGLGVDLPAVHEMLEEDNGRGLHLVMELCQGTLPQNKIVFYTVEGDYFEEVAPNTPETRKEVDPLDEDFHFLNPEEDEGEDEGQGKAKEGSGEDLEAAEEGQHTEDPTDADASSGQKDESSVQGDKDGAGSEDEAMAAVLLGEGSEEGSIKMMLEEDEENRLPSLRVYLWVDQPPEGVLEHHSLCFIKHDREPIPLLDSFSEQCEALEQGFEYTAFTAPSLVTSLEQILRDVYIPLLEHSAIPQGYATGGEGRASDSIRTEFVGSLKKFTQQLSHVKQQVSGEIRIDFPDIIIVAGSAQKVANEEPEVVHIIEETVRGWTEKIRNLIDSEKCKEVGPNESPMADIEFWRDRNASVGTVYEQISSVPALRLLEVLQYKDGLGESEVHSAFVELKKELSNLYSEAKDNVKFLNTLERHFKNLAEGDLVVMYETIPSMLDALRMVWIISRYFNKDARMRPLMIRIADAIADRVSQLIDMPTLLRGTASESIAHLENGRKVLTEWESRYDKKRKQMAEDRQQVRWEFPTSRLFDRTNYMAKRLADMISIVNDVESFRLILGPKLKSVTGEPVAVERTLKKVESALDPICSIEFDVFDMNYASTWSDFFQNFKEKIQRIQDETMQFIDKSFTDLRSAKGAFELQQNFQEFQTRKEIEDLMVKKYPEIFGQFADEIQEVHDIFVENMEKPPRSKNQPEVAGSIYWARSLFHRVSKTWLLFQGSAEKMFTDTLEGQQITRKFHDLARRMQEFETKIFTAWESSVDRDTIEFLKQPVIKRDIDDGRYSVNFNPHLNSIMQEAKYLDRLGFNIPDSAVNVALQEDKYHGLVEGLKEVISNFEHAVQTLRPPERVVMADHIVRLEGTINRGMQSYNWNSLGIQDFIETCQREIHDFQVLSVRVVNLADGIQSVVSSIGRSVLFHVPDGEDVLPGTLELHELDQFLESHMHESILNLTKKYEGISDQLMSIEQLVDPPRPDNPVKPGRSRRLRTYYAYWEKKIFRSIGKLVVTSLATYHHHVRRSSTEAALFRVVFELSPPDVLVEPSKEDMERVLLRLTDKMVDSSKKFFRWMQGTCITANHGRLPDGNSDEVTFWSDISVSNQVVKRRRRVNYSIQYAVQTIEAMRDKWKAHFRHLWSQDRHLVADNFYTQIRERIVEGRKMLGQSTDLDKDPSLIPLADFENTFILLDEVTVDMYRNEKVTKVFFINVDLERLMASIDHMVKGWIVAHGKHVRESAIHLSKKLDSQIDTFSEYLSRPTDQIEELEFVLNVLASIKEAGMEVELKLKNILDAYDLLRDYNIPFEEDDFLYAENIPQKWKSLLEEASQVEQLLAPVKENFKETTRSEVNKFHDEVIRFHKEFFSTGPGVGDIELDKGLERLQYFREELAVKMELKEKNTKSERLFDLEPTEYPELAEVSESIVKIGHVYDTYEVWKHTLEKWSRTLWTEIDIEELSHNTKQFLANLTKKPELRAMRSSLLFKKLEEAIKSFDSSIPLFESLKSEALRPRHWERLMEATGVTFDAGSATRTLRNLVEMELFRFQDTIQEIVAGATRELNIENGIKEIEDKWRFLRLDLSPYKHDRGHVLTSIDDITTTLEENMLNLNAFASNRSAEPFLEQVHSWENRLAKVQEVLEVWMQVQRKWTYLEGIFIGSEDIRQQLPNEAKRFDTIDKGWHKIMSETLKNTNALDACYKAERRYEDLDMLRDELDTCQRGLSEYLETKRNLFPRFFFISDDELLSVLGTSDPEAVQEHMLKMFENCDSLNFQKGSRNITGMTSSEGESFKFLSAVKAEGPVENWLNRVQEEMKRTLHQISKEAVFYYPETPRVEWITSWLGMVSCLGSQIWWTWEVEDSFRAVHEGNKVAVKQLATKLTRQLNDLVEKVRGELTSQERKKLNTSIIIDVHARDIVDRFVRDSVLDAREFDWESQLRFYWRADVDDCRIEQCTGVFGYGFEYMGLNGRLVITPLTDRCFMTLTQALTFNLGGSPAGPAGTGKTESVKDLAKAMGNMCVVFNCGEGLDYKAMGSIFSGLAQCGAWGCFDEFNRIDLPVLSVVSNQIQKIQFALGQHMDMFNFEGHFINLNPNMGIFITMNPGYAGRVELPDNLKALFRPCTMVVPDMEIICEIMLFSEGFQAARVLARKMVTLYSLAKGQLSKQHHYDWGLRALKAVLVMAGSLKRSAPNLSEDVVLMRALRDMNAPKFVFEDVPLFLGLIDDLFPGLRVERVTHEALTQAVVTVMEEGKFQVLPQQVDKVVQLYETMMTRHTTMVVGPTGGGKSVVIQTMSKAQTKLDYKTKLTIINPKAQTVPELYGVLDPNTRDWTDGLLSSLFRRDNNTAFENNRERRYIVFDGDVDAVWVENMNSVMDDNRLLTLPNGERIQLRSPQCQLLFEVGDLSYASPATVSRCGMVYVDPKNLGFQPFVWRWCEQRRNEEQAEVFRLMFSKYVDATVDFVLEGKLPEGSLATRLHTALPYTGLNMVAQLCNLLGTLLPDDSELTEAREIECIFIFCLVWSVGAAVVEKDRSRLDQFIKEICGWNTIDNGPNMDRHVPVGSLPERGTLFDYLFDVELRRWTSWKSMVPAYQAPIDGKFSSILVPTADTVRSTWILRTLVEAGLPVLFVGESGTAKTVIIEKYLNGMEAETTALLTMNFSSRTTSMDVQRTLQDNVEKRTQKIFGPTPGKTLMVFIDDLNMPKIDLYGTQQPIALLKLLLDKGYMFDRSGDVSMIHLRDVQFVAASCPPGAGRNAIDPRFVSLFSTFNITFPSDNVIDHIYSSILTHHLIPFENEVKEAGEKLAEMTRRLLKKIVKRMPPTPAKFHYIFNLRDLSRVFEGLCLSTPDHFSKDISLLRLWRNECLRVFHDRLVSDIDKANACEFIRGLVERFYPDTVHEVLREPLVFGDFENAFDEVDGPRLYKEITKGYDAVKPIVEEFLDLYNAEHQPMNLIMFHDALEHLTRLVRVLGMERGNALLVGVGGSGKQSLTRLATWMLGYDMFQISLCRGYGESHFRDDLKRLYEKLGVENKKMVFLFTDAHVVDEGFLELINNMLTSGMVPALFADDEKTSIIGSVRNEANRAGALDVWGFFVSKCRNNLHIVLSMSPAGDTLRLRCRNFPGMVNNTIIDWYMPWPEDALHAVVSGFMEQEKVPEQFRASIYDHFVRVHSSVTEASLEFAHKLRRHNYVTPKNFLDFISNYKGSLVKNSQLIKSSVDRLEGGLAKIEETSLEILQLQEELKEKKVILEEKTRINDALMAEISEKSIIVQEKSDIAREQNAELSEESKKIAVEKEEAEEELARAEPVLERASEALKNIKRENLVEIRSFAQPPTEVQGVMECVVHLYGTELYEPSWKGAKAMMANPNFLSSLMSFDKDSLSDRKIRHVRSVMNRFDDFSVKTVSNVSIAAGGLLQWVIAMLEYYEVFKTVKPKRERVAKMEFTQRMNEKSLQELQREIQRLNDERSQLEEKFAIGSREKAELEESANIMERRVNAATTLIEGLSSEQARWKKELARLAESEHNLVGDCLLSSAFLSYLGAFTSDFRNHLIYDIWLKDIEERGLPVGVPFRVNDLLTNEVEVSQWASQGLPSDELSVQNGILTTQASRFPLCIDPQQQARNWIREKEGKELHVTTFNDPDFAKKLEIAIMMGQAFLFENVDEELDPLIDPILEKNIQVKGGQKSIILADKEVPWDDGFRLYLCTKLSNPNYAPEVFGRTMIINYSVTETGLEEQLLNEVVSFEESELEEQRHQLIKEMSSNKTMLKKLEDTLLHLLNTSTGNILDNDELIGTLEDTKTQAADIQVQLETATITKEKIEKACDAYRPAAKRGRIIYFVVSSLSAINSMYEYSLSSYLHDVFKVALSKREPSLSVITKVDNIIGLLTELAYDYTCMGIFEKHKDMFAFQLSLNIMEGEGNLVRPELDFFLKGNLALDSAEKKKPFDWIPNQGWKDLLLLERIVEPCEGLSDAVDKNEEEWKSWFDLEAPEDAPFPMGLTGKLSEFQKLCLLRCFRVDRVNLCIRTFIVHIMGDRFVQPPAINFLEVWRLSTPSSPIVCIISPGADPASDIRELAQKMDMSNRLKRVALGQGQGEIARSYVEGAVTKGQWVILENCHLLVSWLRDLEKILEENDKKQQTGKMHQDYRLWITTEPSSSFPIGILQRSLKVVQEPPNNLRLNMRNTFTRLDEDELASCKHALYRPMVFVLTFFHAVVQERRKYGKIGWNVAYDFNESDFSISRRLLKMYLDKAAEFNDPVPWDSLRYLVGEVMYGGRVTDSFDRRVLVTYLNEYMGDFLFDTFQPFHFYYKEEDGVDYKLPPGCDRNSLHYNVYKELIDSLPMKNSPEVFGLHANAEIGYNTNSTRQIWADLIELQPRSTGGSGGKSMEEEVKDLIGDISIRIQDKKFERHIVAMNFDVPTPTQVVLLQELERWNKLISRMVGTLKDLDRALDGEIGMSAELEEILHSLHNGTLPAAWRLLAPATEKKLAGWLDHFERRYQQYKSWVDHGEPKVVWLSGLHIPESYLTALVQTTCRRYKWPLDRSTLYTKVTQFTDRSQIEEGLLDGCYVEGLYLEGASWDYERCCLQRQHPKVLVEPLPIIQVIPVEASKLKLTDTIRAPVYVTQSRRSAGGVGLVFEADLTSFEHPSHWVLQGVALTLNVV